MGKTAIRMMVMMVAALLPLADCASAGDWVSDWITQATVTNPSSFTGQQRGYLNGGGASVRWPSQVTHPVSVSPPSIHAGCGGIDAFAGSMSFMDPNYLVSKFNRIVQNGAALAFGVALDTLASQVSRQMNWLESQLDTLNGLQMSDCGMAKQGLTYVMPYMPDNVKAQAAKEGYIEHNIETSATSVYDAAKEWGGAFVNAMGQKKENPLATGGTLAGCPADITDIFLTPGLLLDHIGAKSTPAMDAAHLKLMRGLVGDIDIQNENNSDATGTFIFYMEINRCSANKENGIESMIGGKIQVQASAYPYTCADSTDANADLLAWSTAGVKGVWDDMYTHAGLTAADKRFLSMTANTPALNYLKYAARLERTDIQDKIANMVARDMAVKIIDDLFTRLDAAYLMAMTIKKNGSTTRGDCKLDTIASELAKVGDLMKEVAEVERKVARFKEQSNNINAYLRRDMGDDIKAMRAAAHERLAKLSIAFNSHGGTSK